MTFTVDDTGVAVLAPVYGEGEGLPAYEPVIERLRSRAGIAEPWHIALLDAIGRWSLPHEQLWGRDWRYVIGGEALDWLTLAHRLCLSIPDAVPPEELEALLFYGHLPEDIGPERFRQLIGPYRYTAHLNFWYGVVVEEALQLVTEDSIRKSRLVRCYGDSDDVVEDAYRHLYGETRANLVPEFLADAGGTWGYDPEDLSLAAWQEFTYWLFKRRIRKWHPARVASDTRRGLERLRELRDDENAADPGHLIIGNPDLLALPKTKQGR
ncbi:MAG: hypothetical protein OXU28_10160 [Chloroflexota bacterium]|nr:hypothetical protein [Rhodospirillaceae bacterium]MDE2960392.1 hypothetical protein [Chloroflexota bacterium]